MAEAIIKNLNAYIENNDIDISIDKIASILGVERETIHTWRFNQGNISLKQAQMLSEILKVKYDELFFDRVNDNIDISFLNWDSLRMISSMMHVDVRRNPKRVENIISRNRDKIQENDIESRLELIRVFILGLSKEELSKRTGINYEKAYVWTQIDRHKISDIISVSILSGISLDYILRGDNLSIIDINLSDALYDALKYMSYALKEQEVM